MTYFLCVCLGGGGGGDGRCVMDGTANKQIKQAGRLEQKARDQLDAINRDLNDLETRISDAGKLLEDALVEGAA